MNSIVDILAREPISRAFFAPVMDWHEHAVGHRLMVEAVLAGDDPAQALLLAAAGDFDRGTADQRAGAMEGLLGCLDVLAAAGRRLAVRDEETRYPPAVAVLHATGERRRAILRAVSADRAAEVLALLLDAVRAAAPHLQRAAPAAPPPPAPPPAPVVNVQLALPAGAVPVEIVSQPATRAVQTVERDADLEIIQTVTTTTPLLSGA
ncbi:MAG: hypothetical protein KDK06_18880 [Gammaproteobacteria bacterium]|nr:hypothetical protein [Gammaproteobacteria bacterium]